MILINSSIPGERTAWLASSWQLYGITHIYNSNYLWYGPEISLEASIIEDADLTDELTENTLLIIGIGSISNGGHYMYYYYYIGPQVHVQHWLCGFESTMP